MVSNTAVKILNYLNMYIFLNINRIHYYIFGVYIVIRLLFFCLGYFDLNHFLDNYLLAKMDLDYVLNPDPASSADPSSGSSNPGPSNPGPGNPGPGNPGPSNSNSHSLGPRYPLSDNPGTGSLNTPDPGNWNANAPLTKSQFDYLMSKLDAHADVRGGLGPRGNSFSLKDSGFLGDHLRSMRLSLQDRASMSTIYRSNFKAGSLHGMGSVQNTA